MEIADKDYVLFHCHHLSSLYQFIVLKFKFHLIDDVVIIVYNDAFCESEFAHNLVKKGIFKAVIKAKEPKNFDEYQYEEFISSYYDNFFLNNNLSFSQIKSIYTASDLNNMFPVYCSIHNKPLIYVEMYKGQFADINRYCFCTKIFGYPKWLEKLYRKYSTLSGDNTKMTSKRYLCKGSIIEYSRKDIIIDFLFEFYSLPAKYRELIISCLGSQKRNNHFNNLLIINSPRWTKLYTKLEAPYHYFPYLLIADYYCDNDVIIKNHPQAGYDYFFEKEIKPIITNLPSIIPIEFYGLIDNFRIDNFISVESSSYQKVEQFINNSIHLGLDYFKFYVYLHRLFTLKMLVANLGGSIDYNQLSFKAGLYKEIKLVNETSFIQISNDNVFDDYIWYIIEKSDMQSISNIFQDASSNEVFVFFDFCSAKEALMITQKNKQCSQIITMEILIKRLRKKILSDEKKEYLYFLSSDQTITGALSTFFLSYKLKYSGLNISVQII